ncbi:MAG: FHA domain-containing protein [Deltaproteobacteria bacterium]|nr:FHA domain-containing protein [Deltaproteobacteria bacterium]MCW5807554.1 FHA domain-containing protein [Deltaproteobacteria bacterium]
MAACLLCSSPRSIGVLCTAHGVAIASPGITSEQIFSRHQSGTASLVDAWGVAHALSESAKIGRDPRVEMAVLHASVSSEHATIEKRDGTWRIIDHQSRNGTEVDGTRVSDHPLSGGNTIRLGDVKLYFWPDSLPKIEPPRGSGRTAPTRRDELVFSAKVTTPKGHLLDLRQRVDGGVLRINEASIELAAMEFGLLQLLVERRRAVSDTELAYVAWHEIADALSFRSVQADSENVRELVHRVRRKLASVSADDLIESKRGVGYRLAGEPG